MFTLFLSSPHMSLQVETLNGLQWLTWIKEILVFDKLPILYLVTLNFTGHPCMPFTTSINLFLYKEKRKIIQSQLGPNVHLQSPHNYQKKLSWFSCCVNWPFVKTEQLKGCFEVKPKVRVESWHKYCTWSVEVIWLIWAMALVLNVSIWQQSFLDSSDFIVVRFPAQTRD